MDATEPPTGGVPESDVPPPGASAAKSVERQAELSPTEQIALELVAAGHSQVAAGEAIGRSAKTIQRLLRRPEAQAFVATAQADRLDQVVGLLGMAAVDAARVVMDELHGESATTRLRAASMVLGSFDRLRSASLRSTAIADLNQKFGQIEMELVDEVDEDG